MPDAGDMALVKYMPARDKTPVSATIYDNRSKNSLWRIIIYCILPDVSFSVSIVASLFLSSGAGTTTNSHNLMRELTDFCLSLGSRLVARAEPA